MFLLRVRHFHSAVLTAAVGLCGAALTQASVIQLLTPADLSPSHENAAFPEPEGTILPSPYTLGTPDNTFIYSLNSGGEFLRGNINGVTFLYNGAQITGIASPVTISVANPLEEIGVGLLSNTQGTTTFSFTAFDNSRALGTFTTNGSFGTSLFAGVRATGGDVITSFTVSSSSNDFVACNCGYVNAVPEPESWMLLSIGGAVAVGIRKRLRVQRTRDGVLFEDQRARRRRG